MKFLWNHEDLLRELEKDEPQLWKGSFFLDTYFFKSNLIKTLYECQYYGDTVLFIK